MDVQQKVIEGRDAFHTMLMVQELEYWRDFENPVTSFEVICTRRGFNAEEIKQLRDCLKWLEIEILK